jgi:hypothetical protein
VDDEDEEEEAAVEVSGLAGELVVVVEDSAWSGARVEAEERCELCTAEGAAIDGV